MSADEVVVVVVVVVVAAGMRLVDDPPANGQPFEELVDKVEGRHARHVPLQFGQQEHLPHLHETFFPSRLVER